MWLEVRQSARSVGMHWGKLRNPKELVATRRQTALIGETPLTVARRRLLLTIIMSRFLTEGFRERLAMCIHLTAMT
jgi:hypothetical protein